MPRVGALAVLLAASMAAAAPLDLVPVAAFHYQLQNLNVAAASASPFPLLVTDYSLDGSAAGELTPAEVASLKSGGAHRSRLPEHRGGRDVPLLLEPDLERPGQERSGPTRLARPDQPLVPR